MFKMLIKFTIALAVVFLLILEVNSQSITPSTRMKNGFYLGANGGYLYPEYFWMYNALSFKTNVDWGFQGEWQPHYDWMGSNNRIYGGFYDTLFGSVPPYPVPPTPPQYATWLPNGYLQGVTHFLNSWHDSVNTPNTAFYRSSKIDRPCFGQRSTYQVEDNSTMIAQRPGYGYVISETGQNENDSNVRVKNCIIGRDEPNKYIAKQLYENNEQTNVITRKDGGFTYYSDRKRVGDNFRWYVKPRMRIDSALANNPNNWNKKVVRVEVFNYDSVLIKSQDILVSNFLVNNNHYNGDYVEMYKFPFSTYLLSVLGEEIATNNIDTSAYYTPREKSRVDYRVYWYGEVNVWLDYVRLDDEWAHFLFTDPFGTLPITVNKYKFGEKIRSEVLALSNQEGFGYFYFDEFYYNSIPCVKEVLRQIKEYNSSTGIVVISPPAGFTGTGQGAGIKNELTLSEMYNTLQQAGLFTDFVATDVYNIFDDSPIPPNLNKPNPGDYPGTKFYKKAVSVNDYDDKLNTNILSAGMRDLYKLNANVIKTSNFNTVFVATIQAHTVESNFQNVGCNDTPKYERKREPTNEEIGLQAYYAMAYGAKQIHFYTQFSSNAIPYCTGYLYDWGLTDTYPNNNIPRYSNYYGQPKWNYIANLDSNLVKIGSYMYQQNDLKYDNTIAIEKSETHKYITGLKSYFRNESAPYNFYPINEDPANKTYWEIGFFENQSEPLSKYFLVLNKRCVPEFPVGFGDVRQAKLILNSNNLQNFNNWKITNPITNEYIIFDKNNMGTGIYLPGSFQPGEGKLLKLAPVMQTGGTFVCNEEVMTSNVICDSTVFNNGYNLSLYQGTTIKFKNKGKIVFNGGNFSSGMIPQNTSYGLTEFSGYNSGTWEGISFEGSSNINISHSVFKNIGYEPQGGSLVPFQNCALSLINCNNFTVQSSSFYMDNKSGAIYYQYNNDDNPNWQNTYIAGNSFIVNESNTNSPLVTSFSSLAAIQMPLRIEGNYFNNSSGASAMAIYINGISGGSIKLNTIHKFSEGLIAANSSVDLFNNLFYTNISGSKSIQGLAGSNINISPNGQYIFGGYNRIRSMNTGSKNIFVDNSLIFLENGDNNFNISNNGGGGDKPYHIYGTFSTSTDEPYPAGFNCFNIDSINTDPFVDVTANGTPVEFYFYSYSCNAMLAGDYEVFTSPGLVNDTIAVNYSGMGGSEKGDGENKNETQISPCKSLMDSINISLRKRQYAVSEIQCRRILTLYPDSSASIDALNKLYLSSLSQDSAGIKMQSLKSFYETVILNNQGKTNLVNRCFYLMQKCKVVLRQYTSALDGFQLIMQQNPYTYEGLVASWDYAATHLLDSINGSGGAYSNRTEEKQLTAFDLTDRYDTTKFTKKQRNDISKTINDVLEGKRVNQTEKIVELQKKSNEGSKEAAKQLQTMKVLNETVKAKKPGTNIELQSIIQSDIKKVFISKAENLKEPKNIIPKTYNLYQNYPNPFNPTTKIAYDIPKDAKVKLVIYDILGREIKTLVNNEFRTAGKYITEFNGSNLASGVYFARILVNEGNDFMAVKKLVLLK